MKFFEKLRKRIADKAIQGLAQKRPTARKATCISDAEEIGILFEGTDEYRKAVEALLEKPQLRGKSVTLLSYLPQKPPKGIQEDDSMFTVKDINWVYKPKSRSINDFLSREYDIVLDLSTQDHYPLLYIMAQVKSMLNVSLYSEKKKNVSDLMIQLNGETEPQTLFNHIDHYINELNKSQQ